MGFDSIWHWVLLLLIVLVVFGTGKLTKMGPDLGNAVRGFKKAMQGDDEDETKVAPRTTADAERLKPDPEPLAGNTRERQRDSTDSK